MTTYQFHVPASYDATLTIALPEELRGEPLEIVVAKEPAKTQDVEIFIANFGQKLSLDEIVAEQGGPRTCISPTSLSEGFPKLWDNEAEVKEFLERRKY